MCCCAVLLIDYKSAGRRRALISDGLFFKSRAIIEQKKLADI